jgi:hypothetical protein
MSTTKRKDLRSRLGRVAVSARANRTSALIALAGACLLTLSLFGDALGIGGQSGLGPNQVAGIVVGALVMLLGVSRWRTTTHPSIPMTVVLLALVALIGTFYFWTASSSGNSFLFGKQLGDQYNLLADSFSSGHLYLKTPVPEALKRLPDPYDPVANQQFRLAGAHDLSLYKGRYYLSWGPTPVVVLFWPWRLLGVGDMPMNFAAALFSVLGLLFSVLLLRVLVRRYLPSTPPWMLVLATLALGLGNVVPYILRRSLVYETAIAAGFCFMSAGLYLLASGLLGGRRSEIRMAAGSACLGLAVGCRPDLGLAVALAAGVGILWWRRDGLATGRERLRAAGILLGPFTALVLLLLVYNYLRFDSAFQFGQGYALGGADVPKRTIFSLAYIPPGAWYFLLAPPRLSLAFPYVLLPPPPAFPGPAPRNYDGVELTSGAFPTAPVTLLVVLVAILAWRRRTAVSRELMIVTGAFTALGGAIAILLAATFWGTTMRYEADYTSVLILAGVLAWFAGFAHLRTQRFRARLLALVGSCLALWTSLVGIALSFNGVGLPNAVSNPLIQGAPQTFHDLEYATSFIPTAVSMIAGHPVITAAQGAPVPNSYLSISQAGTPFAVGNAPTVVKIVSPSRKRIALGASVFPVTPMRGSVVLTSRWGPSPGRAQQTLSIPGSMRLPVQLHRGLNEVWLTAQSLEASKSGAPTSPLQVQLHALRILGG